MIVSSLSALFDSVHLLTRVALRNCQVYVDVAGLS